MSDPSQSGAPLSRRAAREAAARRAAEAGSATPAPSSGQFPATPVRDAMSLPAQPAPAPQSGMPMLPTTSPTPAQMTTGALPVVWQGSSTPVQQQQQQQPQAYTPQQHRQPSAHTQQQQPQAPQPVQQHTPQAPQPVQQHTPQAHTPQAHTPQQPPQPQQQPQPVPSAGSTDDAPWIFGAVEAAPAVPYARGASRSAPSAGSTPEQPATSSTASERTAGDSAASSGTAPDGTSERARVASTATLEDLFTGSTTTDDLGDVPPPPNRRKRRIGGWIALGVVLAVLGGIAAGGWYVWTTYEEQIREVMGWQEPQDYEAGMATGETFITIAEGDTGAPISQSLFEAGVTKTPDAFYDYLIDNGLNPPFVPGVFKLQTMMTSEAALAALEDPANKIENAVLLREGLTVEQSLPVLAEGLEIPLEDFEAAVADPSAYGVDADSLEGWLFPATYPFEPGVTAEQVIARLVEETRAQLAAAGVPAGEEHRVLTEASIIQREVRFEDEMKKVARVIENRLDPANQETFGLLQMDSTAQYGAGEVGQSASTSEAAQDDPNPWNTYVHPGLPIGPISSPGFAAIDAAMHPADGPWLYFVTVNMITGETIFTETYSEHLRYVDQMQTWCAENPDSGC